MTGQEDTSVLPAEAPEPLGEVDAGLDLQSPLKSRLLGAALVAVAGASLVFEQSPANEMVRAAAGFSALDHTGNPIVAGGAVGAITMGVEMGSSSLVAAGLNKQGGPVRRFVNRFIKKDKEEEADLHQTESSPSKDTSQLSGTDMLTALGLGSAIVVAKKHLQEGTPDLNRDLKNAAKASTAIAAVSASIGALAGGGIEYADKIGLGEPAEVAVQFGTDWKFWMGAVLFAQSYSWVRSRLGRYRGSGSEPE